MPISTFSPINDPLSILPYLHQNQNHLSNEGPNLNITLSNEGPNLNLTTVDLESAHPPNSTPSQQKGKPPATSYGLRISTFGWNCCAILAIFLSIWGTVGILMQQQE